MTEQFANFAQGVLAAPITAGQTSISITPTDYTGRPSGASNFPLLGNFRIVVQSFDVTTQIPTSAPEIMLVTAVAGNTFTVQRGAESSTASAFASGAQVVHIATAAVMKAFLVNITGLTKAGTNVSINGLGTSASPYIISASGGGGSGGFSNTAISNGSPYTAGTGQNIYSIYNTSGASYTFNLDATPAANDVCVIIDAQLTATAHPITVQGNGNNISAGGALGTSYEIGGNGGAISLAWDGAQWNQYA